MDVSGECVIAAPVAQVWAALNDPGILKACIRGCAELTRVSDTEMTAIISRQAGPLDTSFVGRFELTGSGAPHSGRITCRWGKSAVDPGKASAKLTLTAIPGGTRLSYALEAATGNEISPVTQGIVEAEAKQFLARFAEIVGRPRVVGVATSGRPDANLVRWAELVLRPAGAARPRAPAWMAAFSPWLTGRRGR